MKDILLGILLFVVEWALWTNLYGHIIYLLDVSKDYDYFFILGGGTIWYILMEFTRLKIEDIKEFLKQHNL